MADKMDKIPTIQGNHPSQTNTTNTTNQTGFPVKTNVNGQTAQTGFPGQTNTTGQTGFPGQPLPFGQTGFPGQPLPTCQTSFPGQSSTTGQTGFPGQTYHTGQAGFQGPPATTGQTCFPGHTNVPQGQVLPGAQFQNQQILTGQTGQTGQEAVYPCGDCVQAGQPDLLAIYRTGNFGKNYGKVNTNRGKKWVLLHVFLTAVMVILTTLALLRMKYYDDTLSYKKYLVLLPCLCCIADVLTCIFAGFFMWRLSNLSNPYRSYKILRIIAQIDVCFNIQFIIIGALSSLLSTDYFLVPQEESASEGSGWGSSGSGKGDVGSKLVFATKAIYVWITILMLVKVFVAYSYYLPGGNSACACCAPCCIMEQSSELAPGIDNPPDLIQIQNNTGQRGV